MVNKISIGQRRKWVDEDVEFIVINQTGIEQWEVKYNNNTAYYSTETLENYTINIE